MGILDTLQQESTISKASGNNYQYVVLQVVLKEKFIGTGSQGLPPAHNFHHQQRQQRPDGRRPHSSYNGF